MKDNRWLQKVDRRFVATANPQTKTESAFEASRDKIEEAILQGSGEGRTIVGLRDIHFAYSTGLVAISKFTLSIKEGEVIAIVGPSGCGKSTLLSIIAGLHESDGSVEWNQSVRSELDESTRRFFTMVFQQDTVLPWLTVERNVAFGLRFLKLSKEEKLRRVDQLLGIAGLAEFRRSYPRELSGGMRRRVALLMGVAPLPKLLLLDEPFAALDEPTRVGVHSDLLKIVYEFNIAVVLVTHDVSEAVSLADRVCVLTKRPAEVAALCEVDAGHHREVDVIRETSLYQEKYREVWSLLRQQMPNRDV